MHSPSYREKYLDFLKIDLFSFTLTIFILFAINVNGKTSNRIRSHTFCTCVQYVNELLDFLYMVKIIIVLYIS
ncbi:MAG: hypothetical protein ACXWB0_06460, partial [Sulfuricurvum sp.]